MPITKPALADVVSRLRERGAIVIAAGEQGGVRWLPGSLAGVWAVTLDWTVPRETCRLDRLNRERRGRFAPRDFRGRFRACRPSENLKG